MAHNVIGLQFASMEPSQARIAGGKRSTDGVARSLRRLQFSEQDDKVVYLMPQT